MRKSATFTLNGWNALKSVGAIGALPRNPRKMLAYDVSLTCATLLLLAIGLVMVYSASIAMAEASAHTGYRPWYFLARHAMFLAIGAVAAFVTFQIPMKACQRLAPWLFIVAGIFLVLVLIPGIGK